MTFQVTVWKLQCEMQMMLWPVSCELVSQFKIWNGEMVQMLEWWNGSMVKIFEIAFKGCIKTFALILRPFGPFPCQWPFARSFRDILMLFSRFFPKLRQGNCTDLNMVSKYLETIHHLIYSLNCFGKKLWPACWNLISKMRISKIISPITYSKPSRLSNTLVLKLLT